MTTTTTTTTTTTQGSVKWFNNAKGYGFLNVDGVDEDIFVHYSSILEEGFKTLKADENVEFELERGPKGLHATDVERHERVS
jgi:CspA family cold shock protein